MSLRSISINKKKLKVCQTWEDTTANHQFNGKVINYTETNGNCVLSNYYAAF